MRILVTGAAGFIGKHLCQRLLSMGYNVVEMDKKWGSTTANTLCIESAIESKPDIIVHLGASCSSPKSLREPAIDFQDNAIGTFNVCEASRKAGGVPIIFTSSVKVVPGIDGVLSPYGISKQIGESYIRAYHSLFDIPYVINRPSTIYGPGQNGSSDGGWFSWFIKAAKTKQQITINGDGTQSRDVLYVSDFVNALISQIQYFNIHANKSFSIGGGISNKVSLNQVLEELNYKNFVHGPRLPGDLQTVVCFNSLGKISGWEPTVSWQEGMKLTMDSIQ